jgi:hypothetical protein
MNGSFSRPRRWVIGGAVVLAAGIAVATALATNSAAAYQHLAASEQAAQSACQAYESEATSGGNTTAVPDTLVESYATTAAGFKSWLLQFPGQQYHTQFQDLSATTELSVCVFRGTYVGPSSSASANNTQASDAVVMITPDGTATPMMWGPSAIESAAPPAP